MKSSKSHHLVKAVQLFEHKLPPPPKGSEHTKSQKHNSFDLRVRLPAGNRSTANKFMNSQYSVQSLSQSRKRSDRTPNNSDIVNNLGSE